MRLYRGRPSTIETDRAASTRLLEVAAAGDPRLASGFPTDRSPSAVETPGPTATPVRWRRLEPAGSRRSSAPSAVEPSPTTARRRSRSPAPNRSRTFDGDRRPLRADDRGHRTRARRRRPRGSTRRTRRRVLSGITLAVDRCAVRWRRRELAIGKGRRYRPARPTAGRGHCRYRHRRRRERTGGRPRGRLRRARTGVRSGRRGRARRRRHRRRARNGPGGARDRSRRRRRAEPRPIAELVDGEPGTYRASRIPTTARQFPMIREGSW